MKPKREFPTNVDLDIHAYSSLKNLISYHSSPLMKRTIDRFIAHSLIDSRASEALTNKMHAFLGQRSYYFKVKPDVIGTGVSG